MIVVRSHLSVALAVSMLGVGLLFHCLWGQPINETLWGDNYDARLLSWIAEWGYQILIVQARPLEFWNAPSFYPHLGTLAYSDSLLSLQFLYSPLRLIGFQPLSALYLSLAGVSTIACLFSAAALRRLCRLQSLELAVCLFVIHFGLSIVAYLPHYQIFGFQFAAPFFLYLLLWIREAHPFDLIRTALLFTLGTCFATYLLPILVTIGSLCAVPFFLYSIRQKGIGFFIRPLTPLHIVAVFALVSFLYCAQIRHYVRFEQTLQSSSLDEAKLYSGKLWSMFMPARAGNSLWYAPAPLDTGFGDAERAYFPGYSVLLLAGLGLIQSLRRKNQTFDCHLGMFLGVLGVSAFTIALGPEVFGAKMPFYYLAQIIPGLDRVRAPGRIGILLAMPLAILAAAGLASLRARLGQNSSQKLCCIALVVVLELIPQFQRFHFTIDADGVYAQVGREIPKQSPIIEVPVAGGDYLNSILGITEQLHGTLIHGGRIIVGYGSRNSPEADELAYLDLRLFRGKAMFRDLVAFAKRQHVSKILVRISRYPKKRAHYLRKALLIEKRFYVSWLNDDTALLHLGPN